MKNFLPFFLTAWILLVTTQNIYAQQNTRLGTGALLFNGGNYNTAIGFHAQHTNTSAVRNTSVGSFSLSTIGKQGNDNVAIGYNASGKSKSGSNNIAIGSSALAENASGRSNIAIGSRAGYQSTSSYNIAIGSLTLEKIQGKSGHNIAIGERSMQEFLSGEHNTMIGHYSGYKVTVAKNNSALGSHTLRNNTTGGDNVAIGYSVLSSNSTGRDNSGLGAHALRNNTEGRSNVAIGNSALNNNTIGEYNVGVGNGALNNNQFGVRNTAIGNSALAVMVGEDTKVGVKGRTNTAVGFASGSAAINSYDNCFYGAYSGYQASSLDLHNSMALGYMSRVSASDQVRIGNQYVNSIGGYANWTNLSDRRFKKDIREDVMGLSFINALTPVTYVVNREKLSRYIEGSEIDMRVAYSQPWSARACGFIAQDVEAVAKALGFDFSGVDRPQNEYDYYGLRYAEFVVPLVKAVQELSTKNQKLEAENRRMTTELKTTIARIERLEEFLLQSLGVTLKD